MSGRKHSVKVSILNEEYSLRTEATPEHVRAIAAHVDELVRRLMGSGGVVETHKAAVLAALQLTDELLRARAALAEATGGVRQLSGEVRRMLPPQKRGLLTPAETARLAGGADAATAPASDDEWFDADEGGGRG
jgi:cell division protein ZapA